MQAVEQLICGSLSNTQEHKLTLYEQIIAAYPELTDTDFRDTIILQNDSDGLGDFIAKWNYSQPLPEGMKVGK